MSCLLLHQLLVSFPLRPLIIPCRCPADCSRFEKRKTKVNQTNTASGERPPCVLCFSQGAQLVRADVDTQKHIGPRLTGLLIRTTSPGFQVYLLFLIIHTHTTPTLIFINRASLGSPLKKAECTFKSSCELKLCPSFTLICRFSFVQTLRPAYLNNTVAPLNCKTNTVRTFAGLSVFSCFIGVLQCTFFSLKWIWIWHLGVK